MCTTILTNLRQYTQYAYYIKTQLLVTNNDNMRNFTQGQSSIKYFRMLPDQPSPPIVTTFEKTENSISLKWFSLVSNVELIDRFYLEVFEHNDDIKQLNDRNYCEDPIKQSIENEKNELNSNNEAYIQKLCCINNDERQLYIHQYDFTNGKNKCSDVTRFYFQYEKYFLANNNNKTLCGLNDSKFNLAFELYGFQVMLEETLKLLDVSNRKRHYKTNNFIGSNNNHKIIYKKNISSNLNEFKINNLKYYTLYTFKLYGCNNMAGCGTYFMHNERTKPLENENDLTPFVEYNDLDLDSNLVFFEPNNSIGYITSFNIQRFHWETGKVYTDCITKMRHANNNFR